MKTKRKIRNIHPWITPAMVAYAVSWMFVPHVGAFLDPRAAEGLHRFPLEATLGARLGVHKYLDAEDAVFDTPLYVLNQRETVSHPCWSMLTFRERYVFGWETRVRSVPSRAAPTVTVSGAQKCSLLFAGADAELLGIDTGYVGHVLAEAQTHGRAVEPLGVDEIRQLLVGFLATRGGKSPGGQRGVYETTETCSEQRTVLRPYSKPSSRAPCSATPRRTLDTKATCLAQSRIFSGGGSNCR